jgi:hypothetical protein
MIVCMDLNCAAPKSDILAAAVLPASNRTPELAACSFTQRLVKSLGRRAGSQTRERACAFGENAPKTANFS